MITQITFKMHNLKEFAFTVAGYRKTGLIGDIPDPRDYKAEERVISLGMPDSDLPARVDLFNTFAMNQGRTMMCTAYSVAGNFSEHNIQEHKDKTIWFDPKELWKYQLRQGDANDSRGATLTSPVKALRENGLTFNGRKYKIDRYAYVEKSNWRSRLAQGFRIHSGSFTNRPMVDSEYNYIVPKYESGGHAWRIIGYDDNKAHWICVNSWGFFGWKNSGVFYIKYGDEKHLFRGFILYDAKDDLLASS